VHFSRVFAHAEDAPDFAHRLLLKKSQQNGLSIQIAERLQQRAEPLAVRDDQAAVAAGSVLRVLQRETAEGAGVD